MATAVGPWASSADVVVIGGGIVGCASAYHLARRGVRVLLLDKGRIGHEQSSRNMGAVRQQARDPVEIPLMIECVRLWEGLSRELGADIEWVQGGNLGLAATTEELQRFERAQHLGRAFGLDCRVLSADEVRAAIPRMTSSWRGGLYTPTDGHASASKTTQAFADAARRHGAVIEDYRAVEGLELSAGRVATVLTDRGPVRTGQVVCAAGAHSARLIRGIGLDLPIRLVRSTVAETGPLPAITRAHVWGDGFVIRQVPSGRVQLNFHSSRAGEYDLTLDALRHLRLFLPVFLRNRTLLRVRVGRPLLADLGRRLPWSAARRRPFAHTVDVEPPSNPDTVERCRQTFFAALPLARRRQGRAHVGRRHRLHPRPPAGFRPCRCPAGVLPCHRVQRARVRHGATGRAPRGRVAGGGKAVIRSGAASLRSLCGGRPPDSGESPLSAVERLGSVIPVAAAFRPPGARGGGGGGPAPRIADENGPAGRGRRRQCGEPITAGREERR